MGSAAVAPPPPPVADSKDVLKLSKSEAGKGGSAGKAGGSADRDRINALQEEVTAKDKALREAQSRVNDLEKQIRVVMRVLRHQVHEQLPLERGEPPAELLVLVLCERAHVGIGARAQLGRGGDVAL